MKPEDHSEHVLVFPSSLLRELGMFQGLHFAHQPFFTSLEAAAEFRIRAEMEQDPRYKQVIPYVIVVHQESVLSYRRGKRSAEGRLTGSRSIGIGGHVTVSDPNLLAPSYVEGMNRELREEIRIGAPFTITPIAALNDDSDEVGRVHFGLVHVMRLDKPIVSANEQVLNDLRFEQLDQLRTHVIEYENWSRICIEHIDALLGGSGPPEHS